MRKFIVGVLAILFAAVVLKAAEELNAVGRTWPPTSMELKFSTVLVDGTKVQDKRSRSSRKGLAVTVSKSSTTTNPKGKALQPRKSLSSIRTCKTGTREKIIGPIVGAVGLGALGAAVGVVKGGPTGGAAGLGIGLVSGATIGIVTGIYWDRHYQTIRIVQ